MKITRYIVGTIGFLLVGFVVAVIVGFIMAMVFPPPPGEYVHVGIGLNWRNLPGTILGLLAGIQSFRASVKGKRKSE
jgi:hypothetical protein